MLLRWVQRITVGSPGWQLVVPLSYNTAETSYVTCTTVVGARRHYDGTTLHTFTTPSSPAVANRSSKPFLGHQTTLLISCMSWALNIFATILCTRVFRLESFALRPTWTREILSVQNGYRSSCHSPRAPRR